MLNRGFATYHPAVAFAFFFGAIVLSVLAARPLAQGIGLLGAALCYALVAGSRAWRALAALAVAFLAIALVNPLFDPHGETVLLTLPWSRPYTLQALLFGVSVACMFSTVLLWFFSFSEVMTSDSLTYLFGWLAPSITLTIVMALRMLPTYRRMARDISEARACIGAGPMQGGVASKVRGSLSVLSSLVTRALEGSIVTADSMRCRGFGSGARSSCRRYAFRARDVVMLALLCVAWLGAAAYLLDGGDSLGLPFAAGGSSPSLAGVAGLLSYCVFCLAPVLIHVFEVISWSISLSKI